MPSAALFESKIRCVDPNRVNALRVWMVVITLLTVNPAAAGTITFIITELPGDTPADATLTLGANLGGWDPGNPDYAFTRDDEGRYTLTLVIEDGTTIEYKVTQGSWQTVERSADGGDIENKTLEVDGDAIVELTVASWSAVDSPPRPSTVSGRVEVIEEVQSPQLGNSRDLLVYLPPDYAESDARYPVLYMHDGQNLFDDATSFSGEWGADEAAEQLAQRGAGVIIVGIPNNADRISEYGPFPDEKYNATGRGAEYAAFVVETIKPLIDQRYRTLPGRTHTGIAGSSMGGLISLYTALVYPDTFGFAGVFSPALFVGDAKIFEWVEAHPNPDVRIYIDMGTREGMASAMDPDAQSARVNETMRMAAMLVGQGNDVKLHIVRGAGHNEGAWRKRFPAVLGWFLETPAADAEP